MESKHENYGAGESKSTKEIEPVSMLFPVTLKPGNSRFQQLAKQAVDVAQIAHLEHLEGVLNGAHCLYSWLMHDLLQCK